MPFKCMDNKALYEFDCTPTWQTETLLSFIRTTDQVSMACLWCDGTLYKSNDMLCHLDLVKPDGSV